MHVFIIRYIVYIIDEIYIFIYIIFINLLHFICLVKIKKN